MGAQAKMNRAMAAVMAAALAAGMVSCAGGRGGGMEELGSADPRRVSAAFEDMSAAQEAERAGKPERAVALYRSGLEKYREFPAGWNNLGVLLMQQRRYLEAAECFVTAGELAPRDPRPPYNLGLTWDRAGYLADALEHYQMALERDPQYLPALRGAIRAERLMGRGSALTLDRLHTALALEGDTSWREWLELQRLRLEASLSGKRAGQ